MTSREELETAHKKSLKALEGEKRAAVKKAKALKGKKGKDALEAVEVDYTTKLHNLEASYQERLTSLVGVGVGSLQITSSVDDGGELTEGAIGDNIGSSSIIESSIEAIDEEARERERKLAKARKKREKQKEQEAKLKEQIELENANAGPSLRQVELEQMQKFLEPLNLRIEEVEADGHCLYRAVAAQSNKDYKEIRALCADTLKANEDDFAPFCEYTDDVTNFDQYVNVVRDTAEWGGHLELRALGMALDRPIHIYSVQSGKDPLTIHDDDTARGASDGNKDPILLSYHLHYYALGEHYNQVVIIKKET